MTEQIVRYTPSTQELAPDYKITCKKCRATYNNRGHYVFHLRYFHKLKNVEINEPHNTVFHCPVEKCKYHIGTPGARFLSSIKYMRQHYQKVHIAKNVVCGNCSKGFISKTLLEAHTKKKDCIYTQRCECCDREIKGRAAFSAHVRRMKKKKIVNQFEREELRKKLVPLAAKQIEQAETSGQQIKAKNISADTQQPFQQLSANPVQLACPLPVQHITIPLQIQFNNCINCANTNMCPQQHQHQPSQIYIPAYIINPNIPQNTYTAQAVPTVVPQQCQSCQVDLSKRDVILESQPNILSPSMPQHQSPGKIVHEQSSVTAEQETDTNAIESSMLKQLATALLALQQPITQDQSTLRIPNTKTDAVNVPKIISGTAAVPGQPIANYCTESPALNTILRDCETQTDSALQTPLENSIFGQTSTHMFTQTNNLCFFKELCLADIETQTNWPYNDKQKDAIGQQQNCQSNGSSTLVLQSNDAAVTTETQTNEFDWKCLHNLDLFVPMETQTDKQGSHQTQTYNINYTKDAATAETQTAHMNGQCEEFLVSTETQTLNAINTIKLAEKCASQNMQTQTTLNNNINCLDYLVSTETQTYENCLNLNNDDFLVSTETQTSFKNYLMDCSMDAETVDAIYNTQYTQTCSELFNEIFGNDAHGPSSAATVIQDNPCQSTQTQT